jgi:hypothetical protein
MTPFLDMYEKAQVLRIIEKTFLDWERVEALVAAHVVTHCAGMGQLYTEQPTIH